MLLPVMHTDPARDALFYDSLRKVGVTNDEFRVAYGYAYQGKSLRETMLVCNPRLKAVYAAISWQNAFDVCEKICSETQTGNPDRLWAIAKCFETFPWDAPPVP